MITFLKTKKWLLGLTLGLTFFGVLWVYLQATHALHLTDPGYAKKKGDPMPVRTATVQEGIVDLTVGGTALTTASQTINVHIGQSRGLSASSPSSDLIISSVLVQDGDKVTRGQKLVELDHEVLEQVAKQKQLAFDSAQAAFDQIKQEVVFNQLIRKLDNESAESNLAFRNKDVSIRNEIIAMFTKLTTGPRLATLMETLEAQSKDAQAKYELAEAQRSIERRKKELAAGPLKDKADLAKASNDLEFARIERDMAKRDLERCQIKSPMDGFINKMAVVPGSVVSVNTILMLVLKLDPIHVVMDFPLDRLDDVAVGQKAEVVLDSFPRETFDGTVIRILPMGSESLRVIPVVIEVANPKNRIKAGLSGYVRLRAKRKAATVPSVAVFQQGDKTVVFKVEEGKAKIREIKLGAMAGNGLQEVCQGLANGDEVIVYPSNFYSHSGNLVKKEAYLQDNTPVNTDWRKWARRND